MFTSTKSRCSNKLETPWELDAPQGEERHTLPAYGPGSSEQDHAPVGTPLQSQIPAEYRFASAEELGRRITAAKATLGRRALILGHHYQRDEIIKHADMRGDSFKLSQYAAARPEAEYIVFCGVHFMAESADLLCAEHQKVILPNMAAGCSMADMAQIDDVLDCWDGLMNAFGNVDRDGRQPVLPVTYVNSSAAVKAFCGESNGICCTSSNAESVLRWAWERSSRVLFLPDQHLGRNTALALGILPEETIVWDPRKPPTQEQLEGKRIILWKGWCSVHNRFTVLQQALARSSDPNVRIIVHPECSQAVVDAADLVGSTEFIIEQVRAAPSGTHWMVGTEINLVNRLQRQHPDQKIECLDPVICPCSTMYRVHPAYLAWVLEGFVEGQVLNRVTVHPRDKHWAKVALERMLSVPPPDRPSRIGAK